MQFLDLPFWEAGIRGLMAMLCEAIYSIMGFFYELFNIVAKSNILTSEDVHPIYQRVTMILTIVMVFYITFQFVKYVVQPDNMTDKEKGAGNIVYKMVIIIVLIAFVPKIFEIAYKVQNVIIEKNVISKVILGPQASVDEKNLGPGFASSVLSMFYYVDAENATKECYDGATCEQIVAKNIADLQKDGKINTLSLGLNETDESDKALITFEFSGLLPVIVGGAIAWILMLYCVDVGVRWAQLLYLQLIAPIPILGYMSPKKDGIFQKWVKQCFTTYLDLFIRVALINVILLLCHTLLQSKLTGGIIPEGTTGMMATLAYVVLIMGVMLFAHKAPKMLAELFPKGGAASGNFGIGWKDASSRVAPEVARTAGAVLGSSRVLTGALHRGIAAHRRKKANEPNKEKEKKHRQELANQRARRSNLARYEKSANLRNQKKDELDSAGKEYAAARKARMDAEKQGKTGAELDRLKQQEQIAKQNATRKGQEYRNASNQMQIDRERYLGKEAIEKEKQERKAAAFAQRDARLEAQRLQQDIPASEQAIKNAEKNSKDAQTEYDKASNSLDIAMQNKSDAEVRKNDATSKIQSAQQELATYEQQKQVAEAKLNEAQKNGLTDQNQIALMKGEIAGIEFQRAKAQQNLTNAQNEFINADVALKNAEQDIADKKQEKTTAESNLKDAKKEETEARENNEKLRENISLQKKQETENIEFIKSKEEKLKNEIDEETIKEVNAKISEQERILESQIAEDVNKRRGTNVVTGALGGAIVGGYHGISEGIKATKLEDIGKKVTEGYKKDIKSINEVQKYYDDGGTKTWVGRTIDKIENTVIGDSLRPNYKTTQMVEIAPKERQIKEAEASIAVETDVKSKVDSAKSRTEDKLETEEVKISKDGFNIPDIIKGNVDISSASTLSDVYRMYKANATTKQSIADAAAKDYETKKAAGITGQELIDAEIRAKNASQEAQNARYYKEQVKKKATEFAFTQILKTPKDDRKNSTVFDQVMVEKISDLEQSIDNARKNNDTVNEMKKILVDAPKENLDKLLKEGTLSQDKKEKLEIQQEKLRKQYEAFITGKFVDYDQLDAVQTTLINIANERTRDVSRWKEEKRQLETSNVTQAQKADSDFSGSGK